MVYLTSEKQVLQPSTDVRLGRVLHHPRGNGRTTEGNQYVALQVRISKQCSGSEAMFHCLWDDSWAVTKGGWNETDL
jgi:hypothetical protein